MAGRLVLVVGPSGAGKDTLIAMARTALASDPRYVFARRVVTRPAVAALEDHDSVNEEAFAARETEGGFALSWRANGLSYGLPAELVHELAAGRVVVANVSRAAVAAAHERFADAAVILVDAKRDVRAARLRQRGREDRGQIADRLQREVDTPLSQAIRIDNSGRIEDGLAQFIDALRTLAVK